MTDLSPTPLTPLDEIERLIGRYAEAIAFDDAPDECEARYKAVLSAIERSLAERDERIETLRKALDSDTECFGLAEEREQKLEEQIAALEARNAALVKALKAAPCGQDGFDNPTWDCGETHCLRCAALTEQQPKEQT